jgi:hypothetical protein
METIRSTVAAVTNPEPETKNIFRLRASVNDFDWGKVGDKSLVARLATEGLGSDFKLDPKAYYSEVSMQRLSSCFHEPDFLLDVDGDTLYRTFLSV